MCGMKSYHTSTPKQDKEGGIYPAFEGARSVLQIVAAGRQILPPTPLNSFPSFARVQQAGNPPCDCFYCGRERLSRALL